MKQYKSVDEFLSDLNPDTRERVHMLRELITQNVAVSEHIKWNSPSYVSDDEDRITFSVRGDVIKIIIHMGAKRKEDKTARPILDDNSKIIKWNSNIRGTITFGDTEDILIKRLDFIHIIENWLKLK